MKPAAADAGQQRREIAGGERPHLEQIQVEHRLLHTGLDDAEDDQHDDAATDLGDHLFSMSGGTQELTGLLQTPPPKLEPPGTPVLPLLLLGSVVMPPLFVAGS